MTLGLDLTETPESGLTIPPGNYVVIADEAEVKDTKNGTGQYINVKFKVLGGKFDGRFLFQMFNIKNANPKAVEIGLSQLKTFMKCAGVQDFKLTSALDLVGLKALAAVKTRTDDFGEKSVISFFKPLPKDGATSGEQAGAEKDIPF